MSLIPDTILENAHGDQSGFSRHYLTLYSMVLGLEAKRVFEFGAGFSTPTFLAALEKTGGHLTTCDVRALSDTGNDVSMLETHKARWTYLQGDSREKVKEVQKEIFDLVLHDGSHEWRVVWRDLVAILPRIKQNGLLLIHDTEHVPTYRLKLAVFLALLFVPHEKVTLPYGYGLTIVRILGNGQNGAIETTWEKERKKKGKKA
jgi:predicted O-methyltransferase YrrM